MGSPSALPACLPWQSPNEYLFCYPGSYVHSPILCALLSSLPPCCACLPPWRQVIGDDAYLDGDFITTVQQRGAAIIKVSGWWLQS
jgi:hypothetical protein